MLEDLDAHAYVDRRRQVVVIFGLRDTRENLKLRMKRKAEHITNDLLREIPLSGANRGRAIRALVKAYGPWLQVRAVGCALREGVRVDRCLNARNGSPHSTSWISGKACINRRPFSN